MPEPQLIVIGAGNMARAIIRGAIRARLEAPAAYTLCDTNPAALDAFTSGPEAPHIRATSTRIADALAVATADDQIMLAVKPQFFPDVARDLKPALASLAANAPRTIISILAGAPTTRIRAALGDHLGVIRVMPNLPASVGLGASAIALAENTTEQDAALARALFSACGRVFPLPEHLIDAFTAVAGSGPAYLFYLAEAMTRGAVEAGIDQETADQVVRQTLLGAATLLTNSEDSPESLRAAVTSKGGTTAAGVAALDSANTMTAIQTAVIAARDRGRELADS